MSPLKKIVKGYQTISSERLDEADGCHLVDFLLIACQG